MHKGLIKRIPTSKEEIAVINRLGLVIHWIGFICLVTMLGGYALDVSGINSNWFSASDLGDVGRQVVRDFTRMLTFTRIEEEHWITFIAVIHWPIKFIITGNKSFFPWKS